MVERWRLFFAEQKLIALLLGAAAIKGVFDLGRLIWFYIVHQPINWDTLVYLTIGRGILNGMKPYTGLYEMKPPGIFLISALSLAVTGDEVFGLWLQIIIQIVIPILFAWAAWKISTESSPTFRTFALIAGAAFGLIISLYAESRSIAFQSEGFGFFFALLFVVAIALRGEMTRTRMIIAAIGILGSVGMKEPFILSAIAAALVLQDNNETVRRSFWKKFIIPFVFAAIGGLILMGLLGYLDGYFNIHLPFIFNSRLTDGLPLPLRGLSIGHVLMDTFIAPLSLFGLLVLGMIGFALRDPHASARDNRRLIVCFFCCILCSTLLWFVLEKAELVGRLEWTNVNGIRLGIREFLSIDAASALWKNSIIGLLTVLIGASVFFTPRYLLPRLLTMLCSLYLVSLAAAVGGFFGSHMIFALPLYCALFFACIKRLHNHQNPRIPQTIFAVVALATLLVAFHKDHYNILQQSIRYNAKENMELSTAFDALIAECAIEKYFVVGDGAMLTSHTQYSPIGPLAFHLPFMADDHPMLMEYYKKGLETAELAVVMENGRNRDVMEYYLPQNGFTRTPPACAEMFTLPSNYLLYFRPT